MKENKPEKIYMNITKYIYTVVLLFLMGACTNNYKKCIRLDGVGLDLRAPSGYVTMNANEYYKHFFKKSGVDKEFARKVIKQLKELSESVTAYSLVQDSTSYKNSILVSSSPYIKINNDNFELLRILTQKQIKEQFKGKANVFVDTFYISKGNYTYGRTCYSVLYDENIVRMDDYVISFPDKLISVLICNENGDEMERMIKEIKK